MRPACYIAGEWRDGGDRRRLRNLNPADHDDLLGDQPLAAVADVADAVAAARDAFPDWARTPAPDRGRVLARAAALARERETEIASTLTREEGKILAEALGEVRKGNSLLEYYAGAGFRLGGRTLPSEARDTFCYTVRQPVGPVGLIAPWNFPWAIPVWKSAPALVAGNTVVLKPAVLTPATACLLAEILAEAGLPPGVFNLVIGGGRDVGQAIVEASDLRAVSFTGSNAVGRGVASTVTARGAKVTCEMGGKNAVVVLADADLERAAAAIHAGAFASTGQRCTATSRVLVEPAVHRELLDRLVAGAEAIRVGRGLEPDVDMGPAVDEQQLRTDLDYIGIGRAEGARLVTGGGRPPGLENGWFVQPTIFDEVEPSMRVFREEIFGPVLSIAEVADFESAIEAANAVEFGLTTSIFTRDLDRAMRYIDRVETGMVHVNEATVGGEAQLPFGGIKATGVGDREMGEPGLHFFTELKTVFVNYSPRSERSFNR